MNAAMAEKIAKTGVEEGDIPPPLAAAEQTVSEVPLRVKGLLAFVAVAIYAVLLTTFTYFKKIELLDEFGRLQKLHEVEDRLRGVEAATFHIVVTVFINSGTDDIPMGVQRFMANFELLKRKNAELMMNFPGAGINLASIEQVMAQATANPSAAGLSAMNAELLKIKSEVTRHIDASREEQKTATEHFQMLWDSTALALVTYGLFGLVLLGAIIGLFFTRLTNDLNILKVRALDIIHGERKALTAISRNDEVGELMQAVNYLAYALDEREKELVIARQRYFYQEKMAAVGALAAGVAHEIGNPIAAMSGVLQEMSDEQNAREGERDYRLDTLQTQIRRLSAIIREISGFASPQSAERDLLDFNGLIRTDARLMSYDKRMHQVNLLLDLDNQLPAIYGVADQLTQVIMNLLINAADALESLEDRQREIKLCSKICDGNVCFSVTDNGCGMSKDTVNRAFEAFYTTKSRGTGLGLSLCYSIITEHGGTIEIDSNSGEGTQVRITLPVDPRNPLHRHPDQEWQARMQAQARNRAQVSGSYPKFVESGSNKL